MHRAEGGGWGALQCMVNAACSESRRLRVRTPLWHFSFEDTKCFFPAHSNRFNIVGSLRHGSNFESFVWRAVSSHSSHHPEEALLAQFSLYAHKGGLKRHSFHFVSSLPTSKQQWINRDISMTLLHYNYNFFTLLLLLFLNKDIGWSSGGHIWQTRDVVYASCLLDICGQHQNSIGSTGTFLWHCWDISMTDTDCFTPEIEFPAELSTRLALSLAVIQSPSYLVSFLSNVNSRWSGER